MTTDMMDKLTRSNKAFMSIVKENAIKKDT